jgi:hypothetical protein
MILTLSSFGLIPGALQALLPMPLYGQTLGLDIGRNCEADVERRRLQSFQYESGN